MSTKPHITLSENEIKSQTHTCVVFGGFDPNIGETGGVQNKTGTYKLLTNLQTLNLKIIDFHGSLSDKNVMVRAFDYIRCNFTKKGKLIIYGYSAGGINAIDLCNYIRNNYMYYDDGVFGGNLSGVGGDEKHEVFVDLLITIDAYDPSFKYKKRIPKNVVCNINIYQTYAQGATGSRGYENWAVDPKLTKICNQDRSNRKKYKEAGSGSMGSGAHSIIDEDTNDLIFSKIASLINGGNLISICKLD